MKINFRKCNPIRYVLSCLIFGVLILSSGCVTSPTTDEKVIVEKPVDNIYVIDKAKIIGEDSKEEILATSKDLDEKYKAQVVVLTVETTGSEDIETFSNRVFRELGIGDKDQNNGVLLVIAKNDHKDRIEVGYGLEETITDGKAGKILSTVNNEFKKDKGNRFNSGIIKGYREIAALVYQQYGDEAYAKELQEEKEHDEMLTLVIIGVVVLLVILAFIADNKTGGGSGGSGGFFIGSYGGSSSSSSGFGDFGGGSSGGGGASSSW